MSWGRFIVKASTQTSLWNYTDAQEQHRQLQDNSHVIIRIIASRQESFQHTLASFRLRILHWLFHTFTFSFLYDWQFILNPCQYLLNFKTLSTHVEFLLTNSGWPVTFSVCRFCQLKNGHTVFPPVTIFCLHQTNLETSLITYQCHCQQIGWFVIS